MVLKAGVMRKVIGLAILTLMLLVPVLAGCTMIQGGADEGEKLQVLESNAIQDEEEHIFISGTAKNVSSSTLDYAKVIVKFYNSKAEVICTSSDNVESLDPGEVWRFEVMYGCRDASEVSNYAIRFSTERN